jgi:hypothetical protein
VGGVFLFSYGYELYNIPRAIRLTAIIVFLTVASVVIVACIVLCAQLRQGNSRVQKEIRRQSKSADDQDQLFRRRGGIPNIGPVIAMGGPGRTHTREVTREVVGSGSAGRAALDRLPVLPAVLRPCRAELCLSRLRCGNAEGIDRRI